MHAFMPQGFLDLSYRGAFFQAVHGIAVPEGHAGGVLRYPDGPCRGAEYDLRHAGAEVPAVSASGENEVLFRA
ncbi:unnamed protein product, partial [marine sediment metagenome]